MEKNYNYEGYSIIDLIFELNLALESSIDSYGSDITPYLTFENERVGMILDEIIKKNSVFRKNDEPVFILDNINKILYKYEIWAAFIYNKMKDGSITKLPISKENINKMTSFFITFSRNNLIDFIKGCALIDDDYVINIIFNKLNDGEKIDIELFGYFLNYLYRSGKLNNNMIDYVYDKLVNNTCGVRNSYISFFQNLNDEIVDKFKQHKFDKEKINNKKVAIFSNDVFRLIFHTIHYDSGYDNPYDSFYQNFNDIILTPLDNDDALSIVTNEINIISNVYNIDYMINYVKNNLSDIKRVESKLDEVGLYSAHFNSILFLLLDHDDISNYDKIEILKVLCTDIKYANNIFNYNYIDPSDFVDIIPKNNSNYLSKFMLFYGNRLSKEELVKLGKHVVLSDNYRLIFNLCDRIDVISIDDFASEILEKSGNDIDSQMINWMIENNRDDELLDRVGSYEKLYAQICHKIVNGEKIDDDIIKKIEDKCNPMFVIQMQFMISELIEMQKKFDDMINSERVRMKKKNMLNKMMMFSGRNTTGRSKTRSLKHGIPKK